MSISVAYQGYNCECDVTSVVKVSRRGWTEVTGQYRFHSRISVRQGNAVERGQKEMSLHLEKEFL